jgi:hypothetical protein
MRRASQSNAQSKLFEAKYYVSNTLHGAKDLADRNEAINEFKQRRSLGRNLQESQHTSQSAKRP